jgi:hypothetical protein
MGFLLAALVGCGSDDEGGGKAKSKPKPALVFEAEPAPSGASVTLRQKELSANRLVLELVGHDATEVYGVAIRLRYDPVVLVFEGLTASPAWAGAPPIALGAAKTPGLLVGALSEKGKAAGVSGKEVVFGTITFALASPAPTKLELLSGRSALVGTDGRAQPNVGWAGGALVWK